MRRRRALATLTASVWVGLAGCLEGVADATGDSGGDDGDDGSDLGGDSAAPADGTDTGGDTEGDEEAIGADSPLIDESLRTVQELPAPGGAWDRRDVSALAIDGTDAVEGTGATYVSPEDAEYLVHVVIWPDAAAAREQASDTYSEWDRAVATGDLTLACDGPSAERAAALLSTSSSIETVDSGTGT